MGRWVRAFRVCKLETFLKLDYKLCGITPIFGKTDVQDRIVDSPSRIEYPGCDCASARFGNPVYSYRDSPNDFLFDRSGERRRFGSAKKFGKVCNT